jgi:hypothetical protein
VEIRKGKDKKKKRKKKYFRKKGERWYRSHEKVKLQLYKLVQDCTISRNGLFEVLTIHLMAQTHLACFVG